VNNDRISIDHWHFGLQTNVSVALTNTERQIPRISDGEHKSNGREDIIRQLRRNGSTNGVFPSQLVSFTCCRNSDIARCIRHYGWRNTMSAAPLLEGRSCDNIELIVTSRLYKQFTAFSCYDLVYSCSGNSLNLYSGDTRFESRVGYRLLWLAFS
jgi:hypothetical protein